MTGTILPHCGQMPRIADDAFIAPGATVIGDVEIGALSGIWYGCILRGDVHAIRIGKRTNIQDGTVIHVTGGLTATIIGDGVTVGHMALIHGCTLEDNSFVGMRATVMDGCVVESGAMVAAGALLPPNKRVPSGELWAGSPAKFMRQLTADAIAGFADTAARYADLAQRHRQDIAAG